MYSSLVAYGEQLKIIIVENEPIILMAMEFSCKPNFVYAYGSGSSFIANLQRIHEANFVFMDYDVGDYNGSELIRMIRAINQDIFILGFSSSDEKAHQAMLDAGANCSMEKRLHKLPELLKKFRQGLPLNET
jgi:CheY-like chemotaxis protein